jgi:hypothetical protein
MPGELIRKEISTAEQHPQLGMQKAKQNCEIGIPLSCCDHASLWLRLQKEQTFPNSGFKYSSQVADCCQMLE